MTHLRPLTSIAAGLAVVLAAATATAQDRDQPPPIAGRVLDAKGQPSGNTWVYLVRRLHPELPADFAACLGDEPYHTVIAVTDARGRFRIEPDGYWPMAMYARRDDGGFAPLLFPVLPGDFTELELRPAAQVRGRVLHEADRGRPAQGHGVEVRISPLLSRENALWGFDVERLLPFVRLHARTDAYGRFEVAVPARSHTRVGVRSADTMLWCDDPEEITLPPSQPLALALRSDGGPVSAAARAHDLSLPERSRRADEHGTAVLSTLGSSPILVVAERHHPVLLEPTDTGGPVALKQGDRLRGRLLRRDGAPLAGARLLFARPFSRGETELRSQFAAWTERTGDDGRLDFGWLEPGVPLCGYVEIDGQFTCFLLRVPGGALDLGDLTVSTGYRIHGAVSAPDRTPAAGAWVFYRPAVPAGETELQHPALKLSLSQVVVADRGGRFAADGLVPGSYELIVRQRGCRPAEQAVVAKTEAEPLRVELSPAPAVRGIVVDQNSNPVAGINVALLQSAEQFRAAARRFGDPLVHLSTRTAPDGTFELADLPADITFELRAYGNHQGRVQHARSTDVPLDGAPVRLVLK